MISEKMNEEGNKQMKRKEAYRDGILFYTEGEVIETSNAVIEVLYSDKKSLDKTFFAEIKGTVLCAHGDTIEDAVLDALEKEVETKISKKEKAKYRNPNFKFNARIFRRLTKACQAGIDKWLEQKKLPKDVKMTLSEFRKAGGGSWADSLEGAIND